MSQYLVRWKFGPNSLLNHLDVDTQWFQHIHPDKKAAVDQYTTLLLNTRPIEAMTVEIFKLVQLVPGEEEPEQEVETYSNGLSPRDKKILTLFGNGWTRNEIAEKLEVHYQTVCLVIRKARA